MLPEDHRRETSHHVHRHADGHIRPDSARTRAHFRRRVQYGIRPGAFCGARSAQSVVSIASTMRAQGFDASGVMAPIRHSREDQRTTCTCGSLFGARNQQGVLRGRLLLAMASPPGFVASTTQGWRVCLKVGLVLEAGSGNADLDIPSCRTTGSCPCLKIRAPLPVRIAAGVSRA